MKQSTKLLSLVLALVMAFGCMSVIGNAALVKGEVKWDNIDDAKLTAEQVADLALDLVDNDLLADMEPIDLSILGELRLNKIDYICADISSLTGGFVWSIGKGLLGDLGDMDFSAIKNKSRSQGDLNMIMNVLQLVGNDTNSNILSKAAYGIGSGNDFLCAFLTKQGVNATTFTLYYKKSRMTKPCSSVDIISVNPIFILN